MAYNQRYNPDALPAHAEPEQAAQMFSGRDPASRREDRPSRRDGQGVTRSDSYANRPPPPIPAPVQSARRDAYDRDPRGSGGYASPIRENSYERDRRHPASPRANNYGYDERPPPRHSSYGSGERPQDTQMGGYSTHERVPPAQSRPPPTPAPPRGGLDRDALWPIFRNVDLDRTGQLSEQELGRALVNGDYTAFDPHTVRMMIRMFDVDKSGTISFDEFCGLWGFLTDWRKLFDRFDVDHSGTISFDEFKDALVTFGYTLSNEYVRLLFRVHDVRNRGVLSFDLFVQSCISLKRMTDVFKKYDQDRDGYITLSFEEFLTEASLQK